MLTNKKKQNRAQKYLHAFAVKSSLIKEPRTHNRERTISSTNGDGKIGCTCKITLISCHRNNNSRRIKDLNVTSETVKLLEENRGKAS